MVLRNGNIWFDSVCKPITAVIIRVTQPLVKQIEAQPLKLPDDDDVRKMQSYNRRENEKHLRERLEEVKSVLPDNTR